MEQNPAQKINYQKKLDSILTNVSLTKPSLLLHACCGPCSSYVLEYLYKYFDITVLYYNPNIYPPQEYERRLAELKKLYENFPPALLGKVRVIEMNYDPDEFYNAVGTRENPELATEPEKGERCRRCYEFRLKKAYEYAKTHSFNYFCTTLSISPFKDAEKLNVIGEQLEREALGQGPRWLPSDFKKKGGFKRSLEISEEYGMYRQDYCGCIYSKNNRKSAIIES
jgi:predicted adenine nucleotide alpha hydrolase (AANH) superfamily ATPase